MKYLKGFRKKTYFSLASMAIFSTLCKLQKFDSLFVYHNFFHQNQEYKTSPPPLVIDIEEII